MIPERMAAMQLVAHGGVDRLVYHTDVPAPEPGNGELLVKVTATAKNNTDRKVREGLYPTERDEDVTSFRIGGQARNQALAIDRPPMERRSPAR